MKVIYLCDLPGAWTWDAWISPVWYSKPFDTSVYGENICDVSVVEPEPRGVHQDRPIVGVVTREEVLNLLLKP